MLLNDMLGAGPIPLLEKTLAFTEARNRVLATNIANITTPGYRAKQLSVSSFQDALKEAVERRSENGGKFKMGETSEISTDEDGLLQASPSEEPVENILHHDGTNARIEREMAGLAENAMMHQAATELLKNRFDSIVKAIRGRVA